MPTAPPNPPSVSLPMGNNLEYDPEWVDNSIWDYYSKELIKILQPNIPISVVDIMMDDLQKKILELGNTAIKQQQCSQPQTQD